MSAKILYWLDVVCSSLAFVLFLMSGSLISLALSAAGAVLAWIVYDVNLRGVRL